MLLEAAHLNHLVSLHLLSLLVHHGQAHLLLSDNLLLQFGLVDLVVQNVFVRILHLCLVHLLLFQLLSRTDSLLLLAISIEHLLLLLGLLALKGEIGHVFLVDVRLFVKCSTLVGQVPLLIRVPRIVLELRLHRLQVTS